MLMIASTGDELGVMVEMAAASGDGMQDLQAHFVTQQLFNECAERQILDGG